jgi:hypothetical protein
MLPPGGRGAMGFSQGDWQELQAKLNAGKIRFGPRLMPRLPIHVPGLPDLDKPKRPPARERRRSRDDPGYERYQLRLW